MKLFFSSFWLRTLRPAAVIFRLLGVSTSAFAARPEEPTPMIFRGACVDFSVLICYGSSLFRSVDPRSCRSERLLWRFGTENGGWAEE